MEGWQWIIIGVVAIVIILWGPSNLPKLVKALGRSKGESNKASKTNVVGNVKNAPSAIVFTAAAPAPALAHN